MECDDGEDIAPSLPIFSSEDLPLGDLLDVGIVNGRLRG
jgi:hypothetical protein